MSLINKQQVGVYSYLLLTRCHVSLLVFIAEVSTLLFMGDQLTVERARNVLKARINSSCSTEALEGLQPAISDWHAECVLLQVCSLPTLEVLLIINCVSIGYVQQTLQGGL